MSNGRLPALAGATKAVEVRHQGELLGALSVSKRRGETLTPIEAKLVDDLAHQAGLVLKNVGLSADLQVRLDEPPGVAPAPGAGAGHGAPAPGTQSSRRRPAAPGGPQGKARPRGDAPGRDPVKAAATLEQLKRDADEALETLRDLARGIYPPLLAEKGLVALESQTRKATVPVRVDVEGIGRYPQ